jgi:hypothetical protein
LGKKVGIFGTKDDSKSMASFYFDSPLLECDRRNLEEQKTVRALHCRPAVAVPRYGPDTHLAHCGAHRSSGCVPNAVVYSQRRPSWLECIAVCVA